MMPFFCVLLFNYAGISRRGHAGPSPPEPACNLRAEGSVLLNEQVKVGIVRESTSLQQRAGLSLLGGNLVVRNLLEMLEKMEEMDQDSDRDVKNLTLLSQGTLRMSHTTVCLG